MNRLHISILPAGLLAVLGLAAYGTYLAVPRSGPIRATAAAALHRRSLVHGPAARVASASATAATGESLLPGRSEAGYGQAIRQNLFSAPQPAPPRPPAPPEKPAPAAVVPPAPPPDPLADAVYAGSVTVDGRTMALIENRSSHEGEYVVAGGQWRGFEVQSTAPGQVTLMVNGAPRTLIVSDALNVVPLSSSAPGGEGAGAAAPPAQVSASLMPLSGAADRAARFLQYQKRGGAEMRLEMFKARGEEMQAANGTVILQEK